MKVELGDFHARLFVDSAPVMERSWAMKGGLGWRGKNSLLLNKRIGSFFFLAEMICDLTFEYDAPTSDHCGSCTKCIDHCPTQAIVEPQVIDSNKCISYLTIEYKKEEFPLDPERKMDNWIYGCDVCQDVCPWNRFSKKHQETKFEPQSTLLNMSNNDWLRLKEEQFDEIFEGSAIKRTKYSGLTRNIRTIDEFDK
ncbi:UNVERIFIED_CONTAM: hypothetical protein GTU68_043750 [Idotea baltica]|nr:hypothetical protein [Idotea baltica]